MRYFAYIAAAILPLLAGGQDPALRGGAPKVEVPIAAAVAGAAATAGIQDKGLYGSWFTATGDPRYINEYENNHITLKITPYR